jgi:Zn-dependent metalloprotease
VVFNGIKADQTPTEMHYFVDARSGKILDQWDTVQTARPGPGGGSSCTATAKVGSGMSLTEGTVAIDTSLCNGTYQMVDLTRGGGATHNMAMKTSGMGALYTDSDNMWGTGLLSNAQTVAVDAHYGVATTWDYYKNVHGRNGIANDGMGAVSRVHYGRNYANAFWSNSCFCMTFGDGDNGASILPLVAIDVAGHEMSHGVTSRSANLTYSGESGGLNEATSDIMGTMVEYYADNSNDPGDYVIGEELFPNNAAMSNAIRWMFKPSLDGASPDCYSSGIGGIDVHYSSGVANHFYYLLAEGAVVPAGFGSGTWANLTTASMVCNGNTAITGIGRDAASKIWYRALTVYMTSNTNYAGARAATLSAAADLYGNGTANYNAVAAAWSAVGVN